MSDGGLEIARARYGCGSWGAQFWFLGIEGRQSATEGGDEEPRVEAEIDEAIDAGIDARAKAWRALGSRELDDCREFYLQMGETRWHGDKAVPHPEWTRLIRALFAYRGLKANKTSLREYQRGKWGCADGETCVLLLLDAAAKDLKTMREREAFLRERIDHIQIKMQERKPAFLVLYGRTKRCQHAWSQLTQEAEPIDTAESGFADFARCGETLLAWAPHPASYGLKDRDWVELGENLRKLATLPTAAMIRGEQDEPRAMAADERSQGWQEESGLWRRSWQGLRRLWRR